MSAPRLELTEAVESFVPSGAAIYLGNFGAQLFAVGHQLLRSGRNDLHVIMGSGGILLDQLIGAGAVREATFAHCWSPVGPAPAWAFRRELEGDGDIILHELSLGMLVAALMAGAWDVPFMPVPDAAGTGYADADWTGGMYSRATAPFGTTAVVSALQPDVAFVHVDAVTPNGHGLLRTPRAEMAVAAQASRRTVLVAEELVDEAAARAEPSRVAVPGLLTEAYVVTPGAVHPDGLVGRYQRDVPRYASYAEAARTTDGLRSWLDEWVYGVDDHAAYRRKLGEQP